MVKLNKIYTRTGDDGSSGLVDGSRLPKSSLRFAAIGAVDEANSALGLLAVALSGTVYLEAVNRVQNDLFDLGADLATPGEDFAPSEMVLRMAQAQVDRLETELDGFNASLAPLTSFILPGGSEAAARAHVARASVRRAERSMVGLAQVEAVNPLALAFINRLSDWLFVLARAINAQGDGDVLWTPGANR